MHKITSVLLTFALSSLALVAVAPSVHAESQDFTSGAFSADESTVYASLGGQAVVDVNFGTDGLWSATNVGTTDACSSGASGGLWDVGYADDNAGTNFVSITAGAENFNTACVFTDLTPAAVIVPKDKFVVIQIQDESEVTIQVASADTDGVVVSSPDSDPGYPTPSLATIVLLGMGLLLVAGVVYQRRRNAE